MAADGSGDLFAGGRAVKLSAAEQRRFEAQYKKNWRTIYRWLQVGEKKGERCPLEEPERMPGWWSRNMKQGVPIEIEEAAVAAARERATDDVRSADVVERPAAASGSTMQDPAGAAPKVKPPEVPVAPTIGSQKSVRLEDFDPEEGDRLRELKQLQAAKFDQLKRALSDGLDTTVMEGKYIKLCETLDKIETRVIERLKKRGLYVLREDVDRDLAANAELLRQARESMERRVLEQCSSLNHEQRIEVGAAIVRARGREDSILCKLDCLKTDDLLRELSAA